MPPAVVDGANITCPFGVNPMSTLGALPSTMVQLGGKPVATIMDIAPGVNIKPFGMCLSLSNPITAAQTAAPLGVLTPGTCIPTIVGPWSPGAPTVLAGNLPVLDSTSMCNCAFGGVITIVVPGVFDVIVP